MLRTRTLAGIVAGVLLAGTTPAIAGLLPGPGAVAPSALPGLTALPADGTVTGIATLSAVPTDTVTSALAGLGLQVQPMRALPLAIVRGPVDALRAAVTTGVADDVYPDEAIQLLDTASSDAMGAAGPRADGLTGKGVTVAVVDSGCDATHADLADHVTHNVKVLSSEYVNATPGEGRAAFYHAEDFGPESNTDLGSGHGTHVAGIIAADSTSDPEGGRFGVAPDAELVCYSIGEVLFTTAVVTAYDHLLQQDDMWGVDVVNNSWGNLYAQFDPDNPVAVATKAVVERGAVVVFAAGNAGSRNGEATLNPFSQSPWIISVAAETLDHVRGDFSSNGFMFDNSEPTPIEQDGVSTFVEDRIGLVHPDVAAPGVDVSSTCDPVGVAIGPCPPDDNAEASGTSMASPHVAGAVAVLLQANPSLSPTDVQRALQVSAEPVVAVDGDGEPTTEAAPFWQVGFGRVSLDAAVDLVDRPGNVSDHLLQLQRARNAEELARTGFRVLRSDLARWDAPRVTLGGSDSRTYELPQVGDATHLKVTIAFPSEGALGDFGFPEPLTLYTVTVRDSSGQVLGTTSPSGIGSAAVLIDLAALDQPVADGDYVVEVSGDRAVSDPDTVDSDSLLNDTVTLQVAQLLPR